MKNSSNERIIKHFAKKIIPKLKQIGDYSTLNSVVFTKPSQLIVDFVHDQFCSPLLRVDGGHLKRFAEQLALSVLAGELHGFRVGHDAARKRFDAPLE